MNFDIDNNKEVIDILLLSDNTHQFSEVSRDYEILFVLEGCVQVTMGGMSRQISGNHLIAINPEIKREYKISDKSLAALFCISRIKLWKLAIGHSIQIECDSLMNTTKSYDNIRFLFKSAISYLIKDGINDKLNKYISYYEILQEIINNHSNWNIITKSNNLTEHETRIHTIIQYIHNNFYEQISLLDLAKHFNLSSSYLSKFIKSSIGIGFWELLNDTRLQYALEDLLKTNMPMSKVAFENGFPNFASFNRVFKRKFDTTPTEYRNANSLIISKENISLNQKTRKKLENYMDESMSVATTSDYVVYTADANLAKPYKKYWNEVYTFGHAFDLLNSDVQNHILQVKKEYNFTYLYISGIFSKELLINLFSTNGFNFSKINRILDFMVSSNIIPFIDIGFQPWVLLGEVSRNIIYDEENLDHLDPKQYEILVTAFIKQCIQRYGEDEIATWKFDMFRNESNPITNQRQPNHAYITLFKTAMSCIKNLIPDAMVGGCGAYTYDPNEFTEWVAVCSSNKMNPDFFSVHVYPYDVTNYNQNNDENSSLREENRHFDASSDPEYIYRKIQTLREILLLYDFDPEKLIVIGWNMSLSCRNYLNDSCYRGAYIIRTIISCLGEISAMSHMGITDLLYEYYAPTFQLFGGFGLLSKGGIKKPAYYAFEFLNRLGHLLISKGSNYIITKDSHDKIYIICHHCGVLSPSYYANPHNDVTYSDVAALTKHEPLNITLQISGLKHQQYLIKKYIVGENNGSVLDELIRLGYIEKIGSDEIDYLSSICVPRQWYEVLEKQNDVLSISTHIQTNEIQYIQITPKADN